jgi:Ulp1 family protease|tara:strand:- start:53 stop:370 length:318 start_codon:yes stop_codon:yes gene_type:complete
MKIIITENQNALARRYLKIIYEVYNRMNESSPCYYRDYHEFDKYKRDLIRSAIDNVVEEDSLEINPRLWTNLRNELLYILNDEIKEFYDKYIKENCPEYNDSDYQ